MRLLTNHIGYESTGEKKAVLMVDTPLSDPVSVQLISMTDKICVDEYLAVYHGTVAKWDCGHFYTIDFSKYTKNGDYYLSIGNVQSHSFTIEGGLLFNQTFSDLLHYFKSQRCSGSFDQQDKHVPILNSSEYVDVHGGWYDASGDVSKYLSHLSYTNYLNPQQIPMVVWNMLKSAQLIKPIDDFPPFLYTRLIEEALHGADFLVRMQNIRGYFYTTVFDQWSKNSKERMICSYSTQKGVRSENFQAGFRQGAGMAIAALASAARLSSHGDFNQNAYLKCAKKGYRHLYINNLKYLPDNQENIIDEYCALLATVELYRSTEQTLYLKESRKWATKLCSKLKHDKQNGFYWSANKNGSRPYFHAAEAGLPVISLCEYISIEPDILKRNKVLEIISLAMLFELSVTQEVTNPFGYPRQLVKSITGSKRNAFFIAQENESGYWWQGENARLASLSCAAFMTKPLLPFASKEFQQQLSQYAQNSLDWIIGLNPYDCCMLDGHGYNNPDYLPDLGFYNAKGGICNGITAGFGNEEGICFNPEAHQNNMLENWRWNEQWLPHAGWYLLAVTCQFINHQQ